MTGPAKQFDREQVLARALDLFWSKGYEATSMQDLVDAMQINRASMYDTFGNKKQLYHEAMEYYCQHGLQQFAASIASAVSPIKNLHQLLQVMLSQMRSKAHLGCFVCNSAVEMGPHDPIVAEKARQFWQAFENAIRVTIEQAITAGEFAKDVDSASAANFLNTVLQGIAVRAKAGASEQELQAMLEVMFKLFVR